MTTRSTNRINLSLSVAIVVAGIATMVFGSVWVGVAAVAAGLVALGAMTQRSRSDAR
jgi:membrane protein implicated in regulation of membrane protease activity